MNVVEFTQIQFWVQIHNMRLDRFSTENAHMIGNGIEIYIKIDKVVENLSNNYLYLKVVVDTEKPLMVGFWW